jgi:predicted ATPase
MIREIYLENFQGMPEGHRVRLAPLTLIFGPNSSGKSSLIRSVLLMKQTMDTSSQLSSKLIFQGEDINLASFANVVNGHDLEKSLKIEITSGIHNFGYAAPRPAGLRTTSQLLDHLECVSLFTNSSEDGIDSVSLSFGFADTSEDVKLFFSGAWIDSEDRYYGLDQRSEEETLSSETISKLNQLYAELQFPGEAKSHFDNDDEFDRFVNRHEAPQDADWAEALSELRFRGLCPVMPLRSPSRLGNEDFQANRIFEIWDALFRVARVSILRTLENVSHIKPLREIPDRLVIVDSSKSDSEWRSLSGDVSRWIEKLTEGRYSLESDNVPSSRLSFMGTIGSKYLVDQRTNTPVSFMDVGVGLSQVLPIVEELVRPASRSSRTVLMEQPELHLHPKMQAELMELFIETSLSPANRIQIIAETHSEAMVLRLQKKIREGIIDRKQVSVLYAYTDQHGANTIRECEIGPDGEFAQDWPLTFADVRVREIF